ncbi:MAG: hypothetical protein IJ379_04085 [Lachnospiraceae bacterium]|nr:hypothetical protein [Lachnospiraceae bacterium]
MQDFLKPTYSMLSKAFPTGIREEEYWVVLHLLYDYMADENLAIVMSALADKPLGTVTNDIYKVCQMDLDVKLLDELKSKLDMCGFREWKNEGV